MAGKGGRDRASDFHRSTHNSTNTNNRALRGDTAVRTDDAYPKLNEQKTANGPPTPHPGRKGGVEGGERADEEARERPNVPYH